MLGVHSPLELQRGVFHVEVARQALLQLVEQLRQVSGQVNADGSG